MSPEEVVARPKRIEVVEQIVTCTRCELHAQCNAPVAFSGPNPASIAIQGEAPEVKEDEMGRPFIGPDGELLRKRLREVDINADDCFIFNSVSCFPHGTPTFEHLNPCRVNREAQLLLADPTWVLLLGKVALSTVSSVLKISGARGRPFRLENKGPVYFCTYHPKAAMKNGAYDKDMAADLAAFAKMVGDGVEAWMDHIVPTCSECRNEEVVWFNEHGLPWCEKHAPFEYLDRMKMLEEERKAVKAVGRKKAPA